MSLNYYPSSLVNLIKNIARLPGIGEKTAERLALHLLNAPDREAHALARSISELREKTQLCSMCFSLSDDKLCRICSNPGREGRLLCVVEQPADMVAIEKSGAYQGLYLYSRALCHLWTVSAPIASRLENSLPESPPARSKK